MHRHWQNLRRWITDTGVMSNDTWRHWQEKSVDHWWQCDSKHCLTAMTKTLLGHWNRCDAKRCVTSLTETRACVDNHSLQNWRLIRWKGEKRAWGGSEPLRDQWKLAAKSQNQTCGHLTSCFFLLVVFKQRYWCCCDQFPSERMTRCQMPVEPTLWGPASTLTRCPLWRKSAKARLASGCDWLHCWQSFWLGQTQRPSASGFDRINVSEKCFV